MHPKCRRLTDMQRNIEKKNKKLTINHEQRERQMHWKCSQFAAKHCILLRQWHNKNAFYDILARIVFIENHKNMNIKTGPMSIEQSERECIGSRNAASVKFSWFHLCILWL